MTTSTGCAWQMDNHLNDEDHLPHPTDGPELPTTSPATGETVETVMKLYTTSNSARTDPQISHSTLMTRDTGRTQCYFTAIQEEILCEITTLTHWFNPHTSPPPDRYSSLVQHSISWHAQNSGPTGTNVKVTLPHASIWKHARNETLRPSRACMPKRKNSMKL